jgi:hypothetical protein
MLLRSGRNVERWGGRDSVCSIPASVSEMLTLTCETIRPMDFRYPIISGPGHLHMLLRRGATLEVRRKRVISDTVCVSAGQAEKDVVEL